MGEAKGVETKELEHHLSTGYHPRDLLKRFTCSNQNQSSAVKTEETEEIELNLGLSLGGKFGVDPKESNKLVRSTSIAGLSTLSRDADVSASMAAATSAQQVMCTTIFRTTSLPTETEEEWRKRKEMQCFRRMEAKRKRSEKQKNIRNGGSSGSRDRASLEGNSEEKRLDVGAPLSAKQQHQQQFVPLGLPSWANRASLVGCQNGKPNAAFASQGFPPPSSQGSVGSQGSISSGISEFDSRPAQGLSNCGEARSPVSVQSLPDQSDQKPNISPTSATKVGMPTKVEEEKATKKPKLMENGAGETGMKVMEDMPCVSTKGDGPNGRKIEGFLYRYKKGEEVRIVCVCHGKFLTPAEFVKHAGGGDVTHPLRHIVVNPSPSLA